MLLARPVVARTDAALATRAEAATRRPRTANGVEHVLCLIQEVARRTKLVPSRNAEAQMRATITRSLRTPRPLRHAGHRTLHRPPRGISFLSTLRPVDWPTPSHDMPMLPRSALARTVVVAALVVACGSTDSPPQSGGSSAGSAPSTPAAAAAAATGAAVRGQAPSDSISVLADRGRIQGSDKAALWMIEASDFQCPFCKTWHDSTYPPLVADYVKTGKVRLAYLNFPLNQHQNAMPAAEAAMCASVQGKFWPMHDALFNTQERWQGLGNAMPVFDSLANGLGVVMPSWRDCVAKHLTRPLIEADYERSRSAGVGSTPSFFVGDQLLSGVQPYGYLRQVIEAQLAKGAGR